MKIQIDTKTLVAFNLSADEYTLLFLMYYQSFETIKEVFGKEKAFNIRKNLVMNTDFILKESEKFTETILSKKTVEKLLGIKGDSINFWEFYNCYPVKVGTRILRSAGPSSQLAQKHEKKYLSKVKSIEDHQKAIKAITTFVMKQKMSNSLNYLPNIETVLNNSLWETWDVLVDAKGLENGSWNSEII